MYEYIEREALRDALYDADAITMNGVKILNQFPPTDVTPVRHGRWEQTGYACGETEFQCSECKQTEWRTRISRFNFCPFCGAKMDAEEGADDE